MNNNIALIIISILCAAIFFMLVFVIVTIKKQRENNGDKNGNLAEKLNLSLENLILKNIRQLSEGAQQQYLEISVKLENSIQKKLEEFKRVIEEKEEAQRITRNEGNAILQNLKIDVSKQVSEIKENEKELLERLHRQVVELKLEIDRKLKELSENNEKKLNQIQNTVAEQLEKNIKTSLEKSLQDIQKYFTELKENIQDLTKVSDAVQKFSVVFSGIKSRGTLGEILLENIISDILPTNQYMKQHTIKGQNKVDIAIKIPTLDKELLLPIDSKFPTTDYQELIDFRNQNPDKREEIEKRQNEYFKALYKQAKSISTKYIEPGLTTEYAIMYLPTEGMFAELACNEDIMKKIRDESIVPAGPTTISALLASISMCLRSAKIGEKAKDVLQMLKNFQGQFNNFMKNLENASKNAEKVVTDLKKVKNSSAKIQNQLLDVELDGEIIEKIDITESKYLLDENENGDFLI